jgi:hypothetical protein
MTTVNYKEAGGCNVLARLVVTVSKTKGVFVNKKRRLWLLRQKEGSLETSIIKKWKKERQDRWCEDEDQPIRTLQEQPTKMLLSAHLISIENEQSWREWV